MLQKAKKKKKKKKKKNNNNSNKNDLLKENNSNNRYLQARLDFIFLGPATSQRATIKVVSETDVRRYLYNSADWKCSLCAQLPFNFKCDLDHWVMGNETVFLVIFNSEAQGNGKKISDFGPLQTNFSSIFTY